MDHLGYSFSDLEFKLKREIRHIYKLKDSEDIDLGKVVFQVSNGDLTVLSQTYSSAVLKLASRQNPRSLLWNNLGLVASAFTEEVIQAVMGNTVISQVSTQDTEMERQANSTYQSLKKQKYGS